MNGRHGRFDDILETEAQRAERERQQRLAYLEGWSKQRLGYPAAPSIGRWSVHFGHGFSDALVSDPKAVPEDLN